MERLHQISPEDPEVMEQYCEFMEEYLSQGLLEEQIERVQRQRYEQLLEKKLKHQEDLHTCVCMVKNLMKLGDFEKAHDFTNYREKMAPTRRVLDFEGSILRRTEAGRRTEKNTR